jgi:hypothetical protein
VRQVSEIEADYLVVGAGAMGMAFTDVLLDETDARVVLIERRARPGGHWNDAYPFVRLHQPSAFYGVNSRELGEGTIDQVGPNAGLFELATGSEVVAYFDNVLHRDFLPSGRVDWHPMCTYEGDRRFRSTVSGETHTVSPNTKVVDASYMKVSVPATSTPSYDVAEDVLAMPLNDLVHTAEPPDGYVVIGAGKTGIDACIWLLTQGVDPEQIRWIMPRDSWLLNRANIQPGLESADASGEGFGGQLRHIAESESVNDMFDRLEAADHLMRIDPAVRPTMYRCATVTKAELAALRRIGNVIRMGRVQRITSDQIVLDEGTIPTTPRTVHVDCTADGLERRPVLPIFAGDQITLQTVRPCQQVFSAAFIAHIEHSVVDDARKNELCTVVPHPDSALDFVETTKGNFLNGMQWFFEPDLAEWLGNARLDAFSGPDDGSGGLAANDALATWLGPAIEKLEEYGSLPA